MTDIKQPNKTGMQPPEPLKKAGEKVKTAAEETGKKGGANTMMGAAAGAVAGATIGGLAGAALADEKTRKTVTDQITNIAKTAGETMRRLDENQDKLKKNLSDTSGTLKDTADSLKDATEPMQKSGTKKM
jgi:gas vesicle protein